MRIRYFFKQAFRDMKESAKAQHEVDCAEFTAVKAESKAFFEEHRGHHTFRKAKEDAKNAQPVVRMQKERETRLAAAQERTLKANARYEAAKQ